MGGFHHEENPLFTTPGWARSMVVHWARLQALRGSGLTGVGAAPFPHAGGYVDQIALVMDAFELFGAWMAERRRDGSGE